MDLTAQPLAELKAPPPQLGVPTVYDLLQGQAEVKLLDLKDKQVEKADRMCGGSFNILL